MRSLSLIIGVLSLFVIKIFAIESLEESAKIIRKLVNDVGIGTISTTFPSNHELSGQPFGLQGYFSECFDDGSLTLLMMPISQTTRNILGNADHNATISIMPSNPRASNYRASLIGSVSFYEDSQTPYGRGKEGERIRSCYLRIHNDSRIWLPPDSIPHNSFFAKFIINHIFFVGGFGDSHRISWIPTSIYENVRNYSHVDYHNDIYDNDNEKIQNLLTYITII